MAAFISKQDYFGISEGVADASLKILSSDDGRTAEVAEATGEDGSIVANNVYGEKLAPSCEYAMDGSVEISANELKLGDVTQITEGTGQEAITRYICLSSFEIGTSAGSAPTFSASGEEVSANGSCTYSLPAFTVTKKHHAQILFGAFSYNDKTTNGGVTTPTGVHLKSASYTASCSISKAEKEGVCLTYDVVEGKIECSLDFIQTGSTKPVITAQNGWVVTSPLASSNPDADWPSWSATLTYYLTKDVEPSS